MDPHHDRKLRARVGIGRPDVDRQPVVASPRPPTPRPGRTRRAEGAAGRTTRPPVHRPSLVPAGARRSEVRRPAASANGMPRNTATPASRLPRTAPAAVRTSDIVMVSFGVPAERLRGHCGLCRRIERRASHFLWPGRRCQSSLGPRAPAMRRCACQISSGRVSNCAKCCSRRPISRRHRSTSIDRSVSRSSAVMSTPSRFSSSAVGMMPTGVWRPATSPSRSRMSHSSGRRLSR